MPRGGPVLSLAIRVFRLGTGQIGQTGTFVTMGSVSVHPLVRVSSSARWHATWWAGAISRHTGVSTRHRSDRSDRHLRDDGFGVSPSAGQGQFVGAVACHVVGRCYLSPYGCFDSAPV